MACTTAQFLAQLGVKGFEEGLIKVLDGVGLLESVKKRAAINTVQDQASPIEHFRQLESFDRLRVGHQVEKLRNHGHAQVAACRVPVEALLGSRRVLLRP